MDMVGNGGLLVMASNRRQILAVLQTILAKQGFPVSGWRFEQWRFSEWRMRIYEELLEVRTVLWSGVLALDVTAITAEDLGDDRGGNE